jgi:hypothetical protein
MQAEALCHQPVGREFYSRCHWTFLSLPNLSSRTMALGSIQPLIEIFLGGKVRPACKAKNLATICEPIV